MIFFTLPNFFYNYEINEKIKRLSLMNPCLFKEKVAFNIASGNFPYAYWNGGLNNNRNLSCIYKDFVKFNDNSTIPLRFKCNNVYLQSIDFEDAMLNTILKIGELGSNYIEISNINLFYFLKEKYPDYNYIFSKDANLLHPFTPEVINKINEQNIFKLISLPNNLSTDIDFINKIEKRNNIELTVNSRCSLKCPNYKECLYQEHSNQYEYSKYSPTIVCQKRAPYCKSDILISLEDIKNIYFPLGITHYQLDDIIDSTFEQYEDFLIKYFIKEEYTQEVKNILSKMRI